MTATHPSHGVAVDQGQDARRLVERARAITERELARYAERTAGSQAATARARQVLPLGVPSSFQAYDPHPIVVRHASGSRMIDVDGNEYVDYDMGFGALFAGHMHPAVRAAVQAQLDDGTLYVTPVRARRRGRRAAPRPLPAAHVALHELRHRGDDGRHPRRQGGDRARPHRQGRGRLPRPPRRGDDLDEAAARPGRPGRLRRSACRGRPGSPRRSWPTPSSSRTTTRLPSSGCWRAATVACFIVEPVMENIGICLPQPGYLEAVREITERARHAAHLRRGQDRHHRRLRRRDRPLRRPARPRHAGQVDRRRLPGRRVRRPPGPDGPDHRRQGPPPRHVQRQPARDGGGQGRAHRGVRGRADGGGDRPQRRARRRLPGDHRRRRPAGAHRPLRRQGLHHVVHRRRCATTATTRPPTSTSPSPSGSTASTAACCCRRASTSSG